MDALLHRLDRKGVWFLVAAWIGRACSPLAAQTPEIDLKLLGGHSATVTAITYTPSGKYLATASADQTIKIWDAATGEELKILQGHTGPVLALAASPDNRFLASGAGDNTLRIWDAPQPEPLHVFEGHTQAVRAVAVSLDGQRYLTAGDDSLARIWRVEDGKLMVALSDLTAPIHKAAYRNDNNQVALGDANGVIRLANALDGKTEGLIGAHAGAVTGLVYHPNNQQFVSTGADGLLKVWRLPVPAPRQLAENTGPVRAVALSNNNQLALAADENAVHVFNPANGQPVRLLEDLAGPALAVAVSPNSALAAAGAASGQIKFWNLADGADRQCLYGHEGAVLAVAFHPDNQRLASAGDDGLIRLWRLPQPAIPLAGHTSDVLAAAVAPSGQIAATGSADNTVRLWNPTNGQAIRQLPGHAAAVTAVAFRNDGSQLATADAAGEVRLWNPNDGAALGVLGAHGAAVTAAAIHPSGELLATTGEDGLLKLWTLPLAAAKLLPGHNAPVGAVAISEDGAFSLTGGGEAGAVRLFDNAAGNQALLLPGHTGPVASLALCGGRAAAGNDQGAITLWKFPTTAEGKLQPQLPADGSGGPIKLFGHTGEVTDLALAPERELLVSAGADGTVRVWNLAARSETLPTDVKTAGVSVVNEDGKLVAIGTRVGDRPAVRICETQTGRVLAELLGHTGDVRALAWSGDGKRLLSGAADKTARLWDLTDPKFPQLAQFDSTGEIASVALSAEGGTILVAGAENIIRRWNSAGEEQQPLAGHTGPLTALAVRGAQLFSGAQDGTVRVWNLSTGAAVRTITHGAPVTALAVSRDGAKLVTAGGDNSLKLWNVADGAAQATLAGHTTPATSLRFNADGSRLVSSASDGLRLWDVAGRLREFHPTGEVAPVGAAFVAMPLAGQPANPASSGERILSAAANGSLRLWEPVVQHVLVGHEGVVHSVAVLADSKRLISGGIDKTARLWSLETGAPLATLAGPVGEVLGVAASTVGPQVAAADATGKTYVWTLPAMLPQAPLPPTHTLLHPAPVRDVAFGGAGKLLATCGDDNIVRVFDPEAGYELERFAGHTTPVLAVAVADAGQTLVTGGGDNTARVWAMSLARTIVAGEGAVNDVAFTPDGAHVLTAGNEPVVKIWDATGKELGRLNGAKAALGCLAIRHDGAQVAALDAAGRTLVWNAADRAVLLTLEPPTTPETPDAAEATKAADKAPPPGSIAFSSDGQNLIVAHKRLLGVYRTADGLMLQRFPQANPVTATAVAPDGIHLVVGRSGAENNAAIERFALERVTAGHNGAVHSLGIAPDGNHLLSGGEDKTVRLWNWADGAAVRSYVGNEGPVTSVAMTSDGSRVVAAGEDGIVRLWLANPPAAEGAEPSADPVPPQATFAQGAPVRSVSVSADNGKIAAASNDGVVRVWEIASGQELERFLGHDGPALAVAFATDNATLVSGGEDKTARAWTLSAVRVIVADEQTVSDLALMAGGAHAVTAGATVKRWNLADGQMLREFPVSESRARALAVRSDEQQLVGADDGGKLYFWNPNDGSVLLQFKAPAPVLGLGFAPDNQKLAAVGEDNRVRFFNPADGSQVHEIVAEKPVHTAVFTRDSRKTLIGGDEDAAQLWAYVSPTAVRTLTGHGAPVYAVAVSPDGRFIVSASGDQTLRLWDAATGAQLKQLTGHQGAVYSAAFSADGALVVSCGADKSIRLWDVLGGRQLKQISASEASLYSVSFHPDGRRVAAAGLDKKIRIYDVLTGQLQATLSEHPDYVYRVKFNKTGDRLLSVGYGGNLIVRDAAGKPLYHAQLGRASNFADLSPDGARLVVAVGNGDVFLLDTPATAR